MSFTNASWKETSVEESFEKDSSTVTRTFFGPWSERQRFIIAAKGGVTLRGSQLFRQLPARDPDYPWLWCSAAKVARIDSEVAGTASANVNPLGVRATHDKCFVTVTYTNPDNNDESDTGGDQSENPSENEKQEMDLASYNWDFSAKQLTLPDKYYQWESVGGGIAAGNDLLKNQQVGAVITFPSVQLVVTRHMCFRKPSNAILSNLGRVNKSAFQFAGDTYPIESLRFESAKVARKVTTNGAKFYEITYNFACQPIYDTLASTGSAGYVGWNRLFNPRTGKWHRAYLQSNHSRYIYLYDEDGPTQTQVPGKTGFALLFHPSAT